jgi:phenylalanyl-tRNA synthetase beta chain
MRIPESWLRSMANPSQETAALAHLLTMSGLEVESCEPVAPAFSGVVVAAVRAVEKHPNADKLALCTVETGGAGEPALAIVCGAPNVRAGMRVALARVGARLPGSGGTPVEIRAAKVRGSESQGMLCSARELGLSDDHSGIIELPGDAPLGRDIREVLDLEDHVFDIKLTPNRADCLSVLGVAREVAALTGAPLVAPRIEPVRPRNDARLAVRVLAPDLCGRFSGRVIRGVNAQAATPEWMKQRLARAGQRPISALVDISNYVMLELGRPTHIFDYDKVRGGALEVRWGKTGERVELLNGQTVEVDESVGVIADAAGVEALAGIMGGEATAVSDATRNIYIEAAFWWPQAVAGRARRYNFSTDAAHRFERGVDYDTTVEHIEHITGLVLEICGGEPGPIDDTVTRLPERRPVRMRVARAQKVIGVPITGDEMADVFRRLALPFEWEGEAFLVTPPSYRFDLEIEEDLIEEVARVHGFERIPAHPPRAAARMSAPPEARRSPHAVRERLAAPIPSGCSTRSPARSRSCARRSSARWSTTCATTSRAKSRGFACSSSAGCSCVIRMVRTGPCRWPGYVSPCAWASRPSDRRSRNSGARPRAVSISTTSRRMLRRCSPRSRSVSRRRRTRRCIPGARPASCARVGRSAGSASCTRSGSANTIFPAR